MLAIDCDLHRIHCWCDSALCGVVCKNAPTLQPILEHLAGMHGVGGTTILFEIASPQAYRDGKAAHYNLAKWMIFNISTATSLWERYNGVLVSPSQRWTLGYEVEARHKMAKATASTKDLRECQAMIAFHRMDPKQWVPFNDYLKEL